jgi:hypothetical protein
MNKHDYKPTRFGEIHQCAACGLCVGGDPGSGGPMIPCLPPSPEEALVGLMEAKLRLARYRSMVDRARYALTALNLGDAGKVLGEMDWG